MTTPVQSYLFGWLPVWFWILTQSPIYIIVVLELWYVHFICLGEACDGVLMPLSYVQGIPPCQVWVVFSMQDRE